MLKMLKIRRSHDRLIFTMGIPIPGKDGLYIETGPWWCTFGLYLAIPSEFNIQKQYVTYKSDEKRFDAHAQGKT